MKEENKQMVLDIISAYNENPSSGPIELIAALLGSIATSLAIIADNIEERSATNEF